MNDEHVLYRGIDFVLKTRKPAEALSQELSRHIRYNQVWRGIRTLVLSLGGLNLSLDAEINRFCRMIDRLSPKAMHCWKACSARLIDIGIDSGSTSLGAKIVPLHLQIKPSTLEKMATIKGELKITVYPYVQQPKDRKPPIKAVFPRTC